MSKEMREHIDKFKRVILNEIILSNSYSKDDIKINPNDKNWKNKLPKMDGYVLLFHNTSNNNLDNILSNGLKLNYLSKRSGHLDSYFGHDIISHRGGNVSIIVALTYDEEFKLRTGVENGKRYNIIIKDGIIQPERIIGYIEIPNTNDGEHNESLVFYKNDKFNPSIKLNIEKEEIEEPEGLGFGKGQNVDDKGIDINYNSNEWD